MNVFLAAMQAVGTMLGIGWLGFWIISRKVLPPQAIQVLGPLVIDIAVPCMVFTDILTRFEPGDFPDWWSLPLWWIGFTLFTGVFTFAAMRLFKKNSRREAGAGLLYPNAVFTPIVVIPGIFGPGSPLLVELYLLTLLYPFFLFNSYEPVFGSGKERKHIGWKRLINPILIATLLALLIKLTGLTNHVPEFVTNITRAVGSLAFPLIMLLIGGNIYLDFRKREKIRVPETVLFVFLKNILLPAVTLLALAFIRPSFPVAFLVFLLSAVPPVTTVPILVNRLKGNVALADQFLVASFLFSLVSLPLAVWIFGLVFPFPA